VIEINPAVVLRNPVLAQRGWDRQQELRARFIEFFGGDEVILSPGEAAERIDECFRGNTDAGFQLPDAAAQSSTIGFIFDERDGLLACADLGMLRDLFAHPALAKDAEHAATLLGCLGSDSITPAPLERLAEEYPDHADDVFRTVLKRPDFRWEVHGEGLLRERKPWYYGTEPRPSGIVLGDRLTELLRT
jgi:hypothetical protein